MLEEILNHGLETLSAPASLAATLRRFTLITRTCPVLAPATLAALPSTRAIPDRDVFCVAAPSNSAHGARQIFPDVRHERTRPFGNKAVTICSRRQTFAASPVQLAPIRVIRVIRGCELP